MTIPLLGACEGNSESGGNPIYSAPDRCMVGGFRVLRPIAGVVELFTELAATSVGEYAVVVSVSVSRRRISVAWC